MDKILQVKKLQISFRTPGGTVKAVRDISFDLERGKTLAIVGESGSGKSVTSKAIIGILAGNSIVNNGEILYDGKDLLKISEEDMCKIRGDKIAMIFQDPLSSLNPIVKIGKQITEAMLLKNKSTRKNAKKEFNSLLAVLKENMIAAGNDEKLVSEKIDTFDKFNIEAIRLENDYNNSAAAATDLKSGIDDFLFLVEKKQKVDVKAESKKFRSFLKKITNNYFRFENEARLAAYETELRQINYTEEKDIVTLDGESANMLASLSALCEKMLGAEKPNFFRIGYWKLKKPGEDLSSVGPAKANEKSLEFLNADFMDEFVVLLVDALRYSFDRALAVKKTVLGELDEARRFYTGTFTRKEAEAKAKTLSALVMDSIDKLETTKDSIAYTFRSSLTSAIERYFSCSKNNVKEEKRFAKETAKREALIARGRNVDWKVVPKNVYSEEMLIGNITLVIDRLAEHYGEYIEKSASIDFHEKAVGLIDHFKEKASLVVYRITKTMAKEKAIKLMEEVGIPEPRNRFRQYPFEFSGGMRQRIVIAIALAADPDILICDEPTTALDVTIQAQILELINNLKKSRNLSVIFITHNLGVVANMADDIAVMYAGKIVEYGSADDVFYDPRHPYTWALLSSMPDLETKEKLDAIPGTPPNMIYPPEGDAFADRNKYALKIDFEKQPPMFRISETHSAATWLLHPDAPKVEVPKIITDRIARMKKAEGENHG